MSKPEFFAVPKAPPVDLVDGEIPDELINRVAEMIPSNCGFFLALVHDGSGRRNFSSNLTKDAAIEELTLALEKVGEVDLTAPTPDA